MGMSLGNGSNNRNRRRSSRANQFSEINITPMVDVMLVLLIIFMVAAPMMTTGVTVELPKASTAPVSGQDEPLVVSIKADGKIYLGQSTPVLLKDLQAKLKAISGEKKDTRIFVRGDKNVGYGTVMQVMGEINSGGFMKVALITEAANPPKTK
jgi:biopolymer transport protein TolR